MMLLVLLGILVKTGNAFVPTYRCYRKSCTFDSSSIAVSLQFHQRSMMRRHAQLQLQSDDGSSIVTMMTRMDQNNTTNRIDDDNVNWINNNNCNEGNNVANSTLDWNHNTATNATALTPMISDPNRAIALESSRSTAPIHAGPIPTASRRTTTAKPKPNATTTTAIKKETAWSSFMDMIQFRHKKSFTNDDNDGQLDYQGALLLSSRDNNNNSSSGNNPKNNTSNITATTTATRQSSISVPPPATNAIVLQNRHMTNSNVSQSPLFISNTTNLVNNATTTTNMTNSNNDVNATNPAIVKRMSFQPKSFFSTWSYQPDGTANIISTGTIPPVQTLLQQPQQQPQFSIQDALANRNPDEVITVKDLQQILMATADAGGFMSSTGGGAVTSGGKSTLRYPLNPIPSSSSTTTGATGGINSAASSSTSSGGSVAFPQMSVLTSRDLMIGTTISSTIIGMLLGLSVLPNLWFVGGLLVGSWGYQLTRNYNNVVLPPQNLNILSELVLQIGRRVALTYLQIKDAINGIWFMYKTGQLSYTYYKQYATLDQRFAITDKIDAWNARFQQGKRAFDEWERENEIGRKVLATLRTVWLVEEERTSKQGRNSSSNKRFMAMAGSDGTPHRYRIVQYMYNIKHWFQTLARTVWNKLEKMAGGDWSDVAYVLRGIRKSILSPRRRGKGTDDDDEELYGGLDEVVIRVGAALGAFVVLNLVGAMFALWPNVLGLLAVVTGLVWPSWVSELRERVAVLLTDLRNQGASGAGSYTTESGSRDDNVDVIMNLGKQQFYDSSKYSYFKRRDGSKRWYRTGQSINWGMTPQKNQPKKKSGFLSFLQLPQSVHKKKTRREPGKEQWGHFSRK